MAAGTILAGQRRLQHARADGPVLQRGGVVVQPDQPRQAPPQLGKQVAQRGHALGAQIGGDPADHDPIAHQPVPEAGIRGTQHALAQNAGMGVHQREGGIVADRADVAQVVGDPLELGHQRTQPDRARRRLDRQGRLGRPRERVGVGDRAVARGAPGELGRALQGRPGDQALDALVDIAQALLQADHGLAACGEAKMAGLDDAGMHRADRDLVQALALGRQERIVRSRVSSRLLRAQRVTDRPAAVVEPGAGIRQALGLEPEQITDGPLEPDRRRVMLADRGKAIGACQAGDADLAGRLVQERHVHGAHLAPQAEQGPLAARQALYRGTPDLGRDHGTRPWPVLPDPAVLGHQVGEAGHAPSPPASRADRRHSGTTPPAPAAARCPHPRRGRDGRTSAHTTLRPVPCRPALGRTPRH